MARYEAVDRLMALATEKRADRLPTDVPATRIAAGVAPPSEAETAFLPGGPVSPASPAPVAPQSAAARSRQLLAAVRPLLPAVAGAMRLVDHGAVQALARLLPLLGGATPGTAQGPSEQAGHALAEVQAAQLAHRRELESVALKVETLDDQLARTRKQLERVVAEQAGREDELHTLADRVRLLSAGSIILFMLIIAQMILMVVLLHK